MTHSEHHRLCAAQEAAWQAIRLAGDGTPEASRRACDHYQDCRARLRAAVLDAEMGRAV